MSKLILTLIFCLQASMAWAFTIATGPSDGSYFQIAQDIKNVAAKENIDLQVMPTKGSIENIQLLGSGKVDLAIVQLDALRFVSDVLKKQKDFDLFGSIKVILNLYPEEIHVLSNKNDIESFYQLEGKRLSVGTEGGGTAITAAVLLSVYDLNVTVSFDSFDEAMKKMEQGNLDAVMFVGGAPVPFIGKLDSKLHFVRLTANPALEQIYLRTNVGKSQYSWAAADTETYAVPASLMGVDKKEEKYAAQMQKLVLSILNSADDLRASGHPKWKSSIIQTYFPYRGYEPTNQVIEVFNFLDNQGYKITKK
ncbi:MAG TPA: TAXI family TRAP transporter solute-binding subunit [Candidatus Binatia bacterium]|nr:TAXI family TRAP transporter solute-binding subunit [Candidatus Binatia bacterium]